MIRRIGVPAGSDRGIAFLANIKTPDGSGPAILGFGENLIDIRKGQPAPGIEGAVFKTFKDPLIDNNGGIAFVATVGGDSVTKADDQGIWTNGFSGQLELVAREGGAAPGVPNAKFKTFKSVVIDSPVQQVPPAIMSDGPVAAGSASFEPPSMAFVARLETGAQGTEGPGGVTKDNDVGLWIRHRSGILSLTIREGDPIAGSTVKSFVALAPRSKANGQGRPIVRGGVHARVKLADKRQAWILAGPGYWQILAITGNPIPGFSDGATYKNFGLAAQNNNTSAIFVATAKGGDATLATNQAIIQEDADFDQYAVVRKGDVIPEIEGAKFASFINPVNNASYEAAFIAKAKGQGITTANDFGLWVVSGLPSALVAREGDQLPGTEEGSALKNFVSFALPDEQGPIFVGKLQTGPKGTEGPGGVTKDNDVGLWAGYPGAVKLLLREGQQIAVDQEGEDIRTVKSFVTLKSVAGSPAQARWFDQKGNVIARVQFTDGSTAVVIVSRLLLQ